MKTLVLIFLLGASRLVIAQDYEVFHILAYDTNYYSLEGPVDVLIELAAEDSSKFHTSPEGTFYDGVYPFYVFKSSNKDGIYYTYYGCSNYNLYSKKTKIINTKTS